MSFWDSLGRLAKFLTETPGYTPSAEAGQRAPSAGYRPDSMGKTPAQTPKTAAVPVPGAITRYNVASLADISKNLPDSPGSWNDSVESLRKETVELGGRAFTGALNVLEVATGPGELKPSLEKVAPALAAGLENVRKNYAFSRDLEANSSGMGLLNAMGTIGAGVLAGLGVAGAIATAPVSLPFLATAGTIVGAGTLTAGLVGAAQRKVAATGALGETAQESALRAEKEETRNKYNFGNDVVKSAARIGGAVSPFGDTTPQIYNTDYGIGKVAKDVLNIVFEFGVTPDIGAGRVAGGFVRGARGGAIKPIEKSLSGFILSKPLAKQFESATSNRLKQDVDLIKRTVAGEKTVYTPMFEFFEQSTPALIAQRSEFRNLIGQDAANLLAGRTRDEIGLILRAGRGDGDALDEIKNKHKDIHNEIVRLEGAVKAVQNGGILQLQYNGNNMYLSKAFKANLQNIDDEIKALREKRSWFDNAMGLGSALQDRTASPYLWVERLRNDLAKERLSKKLELSKAGVNVPILRNVFSLKKDRTPDTLGRETGLGKAIQFVYQKNAFSPLVRFIDRRTDEVPRTWINYNDPIQSPERFRLNVRAAVKLKMEGFTPDDAEKFYNDFIKAKKESDKNNIIKEYTQKIASAVGKKYGIPSLTIQQVLLEYDKQYSTLLAQAAEASAKQRGYVFGPGGIDEVINDPQLISQLANGAILPDIALWDKAFKKYRKKTGIDASVAGNPLITGQFLAEEFNSLWRGFTLARAGYPVNIIRDSAIRMYGDMAMFGSMKELSQEAVESLFNVDQSAQRIRFTLANINNGSYKLNKVRKQINKHQAILNGSKEALKRAGYDLDNPPKKTPTDALMLENIDSYNKINLQYNELRRQEAVLSNMKKIAPRVGRDKNISYLGVDYPAPFSGRLGQISLRSIGQIDELRRALGSTRDLNIRTARNQRGGSSTVIATENEALHMAEWIQTLDDIIAFDDVAKKIIGGESKRNIIRWLAGPEGASYMDRMSITERGKVRVGLKTTEAEFQYGRVSALLDMFAPGPDIRKLILENKVTADNLRKLYPDPAARPPLLTDMVLDTLGRSNTYLWARDTIRDTVAWLSTRPTAALMYNPYFAFKYNQKFQTMIHIANVQNRQLTGKDKERFEAIARQYAIKEYREKLNSFHRDMNYGGMINYLLAFFPAVIEQYRAYGRIMLDNPDFAVKAGQVSVIPSEYFNAQENAFGDEYVEVDLPLIGPSYMKHRLPATWFNPLNPTGGNSIISVGPAGSLVTNYLSKKFNWDNAFTNWALPFGAREDNLSFLTPNTIKRGSELFKAWVSKSGDQFNKDTAKLLDYKRFEFIKEFDREPSRQEQIALNEEAMGDAVALAWGRFVNAGLLPTQPQYVTPLQVYTDELFKMREADPINGEDRFIKKYPDYFMLMDSLTNPTSGIVPDETAIYLLKKNENVLKSIVAEVNLDNLTVLGSVFNDENYAFSSSANAYLQDKTIPNTNKKFREYNNAFQAQRSSIINKGWDDFTKFKDIVTLAITENRYSPTKGYGKNLYDKYMDAFIEKSKTQNSTWYKEWDTQSGSGSKGYKADVITALTIAANDDKLWGDLQKQERWHSIINYLNFRYDVYDELERRKTTIDSSKAKDLRQKVNEFVFNLRATDVKFGKFYDRYLENDKFDFIYEGQG